MALVSGPGSLGLGSQTFKGVGKACQDMVYFKVGTYSYLTGGG